MRTAIALSVLLLSGCGGGTVFDKPGVTPDQARLDLKRCEQIAAKGQIESLSGFDRAREQQMASDDCMAARGYQRVPKP
jgi:hypothetical protein